MTTKQDVLEKQEKYLWPNHILYYTDPLPLSHGEGMYVYDVEGNKYLDFFAGDFDDERRPRPSRGRRCGHRADQEDDPLIYPLSQRTTRQSGRKNG